MTIEQIAQICHEANKALCVSHGDFSQTSWDNAEEWQRQAAIQGVTFALQNPNAPASAQHEDWMADKIAGGWQYGEAKDAEAKTHPCLVPYHELPDEQKAKDYLFKGIVNSLAPFVEGEGQAV